MKVIRRRRTWSSDSGDEVDNDRLRAGQDYWSSCARQASAGCPVVTIITNVTASANRKPDEILWRGAKGAVLANLLENAGYRVEFWGVQYVHPGYKDGAGLFGGVRIKRADQPLDIATLINAVSGWFYRTIYFQSYLVEERSEPASGLGHVQPLRETLPQIQELAGNGKTVLIEGIWDRSAALAKVREVIQALNE